MIPVEYYLIIASVLVLISVGITRFSENLGIPALILFIGIGMLAGSDGPGGIEFDNAYIAQFVGVVALIFILFAGGLDTSWEEVKPVSAASFSLATIGVVLTAAIVGLLTHYLLGLSLYEGLLIGAIISSTDAAAVFSVLRSKGVSLKNNLKPLLELESGSNDPMAVFLTIGLIELITKPESSMLNLGKLFLMQMGIGAASGLIFGRGINLLLNYVKTSYEGVYSVFLFASAVFIYSVTALMQGSGFLAVYIAGIIIGNHKFVQLKAVSKFFDSVAWLSQIIVFLILGLLVFPSQLIKVTGNGLLLSFILIFLARPVSVFVSLAFSRFSLREKLFISWVGLRGAVPIVLATFPLMYGIAGAGYFFSLIFFIVITSALLQGWTLTRVGSLLGVNAPYIKTPQPPIELMPVEGVNADLVDFYIFEGSSHTGKPISSLGLPSDCLVVLINRNENYLVPNGNMIMKKGDILLTLVSNSSLQNVRNIFSH